MGQTTMTNWKNSDTYFNHQKLPLGKVTNTKRTISPQVMAMEVISRVNTQLEGSKGLHHLTRLYRMSTTTLINILGKAMRTWKHIQLLQVETTQFIQKVIYISRRHQ